MTKLIGITGGIGSGKSFICNIFRKLSVPVYEADIQSKRLVNTSEIIRKELTEEYGKDIYLQNGDINKAKLANIIFNNKHELEKVNRIIHPVVFNDFKEWCDNHKNKKYMIHEAAIMFESGVNKLMNAVVFIDAPKDIRIKRVIQRDKICEKDVLMRIKNQMSEEEKKKLSDHVIINDDKEYLLPQILKLHNIFNN